MLQLGRKSQVLLTETPTKRSRALGTPTPGGVPTPV